VQEKEEEGKFKQIPVYFAPEAPSWSKLFYSKLEKISYAVVMAARTLRHYFEGHKIYKSHHKSTTEQFVCE
jgi:hypothetical protein